MCTAYLWTECAKKQHAGDELAVARAVLNLPRHARAAVFQQQPRDCIRALIYHLLNHSLTACPQRDNTLILAAQKRHLSHHLEGVRTQALPIVHRLTQKAQKDCDFLCEVAPALLLDAAFGLVRGQKLPHGALHHFA